MSIVAAMVFPREGVLMYADKRSVTDQGMERVIEDNFVKIHLITQQIIGGITGNAHFGLSVLLELQRSGLKKASEMIGFIESLPVSPQRRSTITIGGMFDDGKPFLWTFMFSNGSKTMEREKIGYSIATYPEELGESCGRFLIHAFENSKNPHLTLANTIKFASDQSEFISTLYDSLFIPYKAP